VSTTQQPVVIVSCRVFQNLLENMIVTVEPGVYFPKKFGIRIEDDVLITKKGNKTLTSSTRKLIAVSRKK